MSDFKKGIMSINIKYFNVKLIQHPVICVLYGESSTLSQKSRIYLNKNLSQVNQIYIQVIQNTNDELPLPTYVYRNRVARSRYLRDSRESKFYDLLRAGIYNII